jgi:predicted DNA-binding protein
MKKAIVFRNESDFEIVDNYAKRLGMQRTKAIVNAIEKGEQIEDLLSKNRTLEMLLSGKYGSFSGRVEADSE